MQTTFKYDVALSYAGEDRLAVSSLVNALLDRRLNVFYDEDQRAELWDQAQWSSFVPSVAVSMHEIKLLGVEGPCQPKADRIGDDFQSAPN
jgi:hypothetical protein